MSMIEIRVDERGTVYILREGERVYTAVDRDGQTSERHTVPASSSLTHARMPEYGVHPLGRVPHDHGLAPVDERGPRSA